ncbi:MAG: endolytic transglycosylase MltG [Clostridia bacterium]|nr:endolytic transglycosylase MltG [Clostridia bacterium]
MQNNNFNINDDDFIIGKGFNVQEPEQNKKGKRRKGKKGVSVIKNIIWIVCIIVVSVALAGTSVVGLFDYAGLGFGRGEKAEIDIPLGTPTVTIAEKLEQAGAIKMPILFRAFSKLKGYESQYKYGLYTFNTDIGYSGIADMLMNDGAVAESVKVTIPEGTGINDYTHIVDGEKKTIKGIATILEESGVCSKTDFLYALNEVELDTKLLKNCNEEKTYYTLEGYLFPDTYDFYSYDSAECAQMVVEKMIKQLESKITDDMYKRAEELGYSMNEILTMASIIQMESGQKTEEMANVAAVFYNRLNSKDFATLGSSPTCYYGGSFKNDDERYDTYKAKGLPPGPLCSPGIDAIKAALYPATDKEGYFYFVTDKNSNFYYHKTMAEQNATIAKLQQGDNWVYETFE